MNLLTRISFGVFAVCCLSGSAHAQLFNLFGNSEPQGVQEYYCINDTEVLEQPLCVPIAEAQPTPSVRGSHSLKQEERVVATKADIILLSAKVAKLEARLAKIPNTFNNCQKTDQLKEEILATHYQLTMLTTVLSN